MICINNTDECLGEESKLIPKNYIPLTIGKTYIIIDTVLDNKLHSVVDDQGYKGLYSVLRFISLEEYRLVKLNNLGI